MMLANILFFMICAVLLFIVFVVGLRFGYKGTVSYLQLKGLLADNWIQTENIVDENNIDNCEHCEERTILYKCSIKKNSYNMCESCIAIMNAAPSHGINNSDFL